MIEGETSPEQLEKDGFYYAGRDFIDSRLEIYKKNIQQTIVYDREIGVAKITENIYTGRR